MDAAQVTRRSVLAMPVALGVLAACGTGGTDGTDDPSDEITMA
jgi:hypothetical protein